MIESVESGRDIPKYGDGNTFSNTIQILRKCPEGTSPSMGTETVKAARTPSKFVRKGHPQVWGRKLFGSRSFSTTCPEGTSPSMGTETQHPHHPLSYWSGRDIPKYGDGNTASKRRLLS